jgi:hypothetical protein
MPIIKMSIEIFGKLPFDIIVNHILPYTYRTKPPRHLADIRSFYSDFKFVANYYYYDLNEYILLRDIVQFYNNNSPVDAGIEHLFTVRLNRSIVFQKISLEEKYVFIFTHYKDHILRNADKKIKFLWGLMKPKERTVFINYFIIRQLEKIELE